MAQENGLGSILVDFDEVLRPVAAQNLSRSTLPHKEIPKEYRPSPEWSEQIHVSQKIGPMTNLVA
jgi:hypothetical protein